MSTVQGTAMSADSAYVAEDFAAQFALANDPSMIQYALQGEYLIRITAPWQRSRVAQGIRRNDLMALRFTFPAS